MGFNVPPDGYVVPPDIKPKHERSRGILDPDHLDVLRMHYEAARDWTAIARDLETCRHGARLRPGEADRVARQIWDRLYPKAKQRDPSDEPDQATAWPTGGPSYRGDT